MSLENVQNYLKQFGMQDRIQVLPESSATVELAANALHTEPKRIAKTLSFSAGDRTLLIVAAGDAKIDNQKYKAEFGTKAKMLNADEAEERIGHAVGGVCPFAVKQGVEVYLDESLKRFETVYPACGSANSAIELTIDELTRCTGDAVWIDVSKGWQDE